MEPRGYIAGGQHAAAPPVRSPESASTIWRLLAGTHDEDSTVQISVLTFCKTKGDRDMKKALLALSLLMVGCSTSVTPPSEASFAPSDRTFKFQQSDSNQSITVVRDSGFIGGGCFASVYIDGQLSAKLEPKEKVRFYLSKGEHAVGAALEGRGLCGANEARQERYINLGDGENKYVRIFIDEGGDLDIRPTTLK